MENLKRILESPEIIVFLGAGACWDSGLPMGDKAAELLVDACFEAGGISDFQPTPTASDKSSWPRFEVVLDVLSRYIPSAPADIVESFLGIGQASTHRFLAGLPGKVNVLTTNFDDQMERAFTEYSVPFKVISSRSEMQEVTNIECSWVLKLHGDSMALNPEKDFGVQIDQILRGFPASSADAVQEAASGNPLLFIGYAARDPDLAILVEQLIREAEYVAWIDVGEATETVGNLLAMAKVGSFYDAGSPAAMGTAVSKVPSAANKNDSGWIKKIDEWANQQSKNSLKQAAAAFCLERGDRSALGSVKKIHKTLSVEISEQHTLWKMEREAEVHLRADVLDEGLLQSVSTNLMDFSKQSSTSSATACDALVAHAGIHFRTGHLDRAVTTLKTALNHARRQDDVQRLIRTLNSLGISSIYAGGPEFGKGMRCFREALELSRFHEHPIMEAESAMRLAVGLMRSDKAEEAVRLLESTESVELEIGNQRRLLVWRVNKGEALRIAGRAGEAVALNEEIIAEAEAIGDAEVVMNALGNLANCLTGLGRIGAAESAFIKAKQISRTEQSGEAYGNYLYNRGWIRGTIGEWEQAVDWFNRAAQVFTDGGMVERAGGALGLAAWCYVRQGNIDSAQKCLLRVDEIEARPSSGIFKRDWELGSFACQMALSGEVVTRSVIECAFENEEAVFLLAHWGIERQGALLECEINNLIKLAFEVAEKAEMGTFWALLADVLERRGNVPDQWVGRLERARRNRPKPLCQLVNELQAE
ncbi:MAG: tetratricopeptide repeat protein [Kiritimatiellae bacterium]|nr:tetratricopeptide repeat protein [Kiritimatiellia bacterium]